MGLKNFFSAITIVGDFKKLFTKESVALLFAYIKEQITKYVNNSDLLGPQKKAAVDEAVISYIKKNFKSKNKYLTMGVDLLIQYEPQITEAVYQWLRANIKGLTEPTPTAV